MRLNLKDGKLLRIERTHDPFVLLQASPWLSITGGMVVFMDRSERLELAYPIRTILSITQVDG